MARKEKGMSYSDFLKFLDTLPTIDAFTSPTARPPMSDKKFQLMYKMMFYCGLKPVECFELKKSDVDLEHYELLIRKKSGDVEKTTLSPNIVSQLRDHIKNLPTQRLLFTSRKVTRKFGRALPWTYAKVAGEKAGLELFKISKAKSVEGISLSIFRNSLEQYMKECKASKNLIDRKLRKPTDNNYGNVSIDDLKKWEQTIFKQTLTETLYQIRFTHATSGQNFPISMKSFNEFPVSTMFNSSHLDMNLFAFTSNEHARDTDFLTNYHNKFRLIVKLFIDYRLNLESFKPNDVQNIDLSKQYPKNSIINFDDSNYMNSDLDSAQKDLLEHLDDLAQGRLKTAIPNVVNWMDAYVGKNSSGFCVLRNAYQHPDLLEDTKKQLEKKFKGKVIFNPNGSIDRDAKENLKILQDCVIPILTEIKNAFYDRYFDSEELPHKVYY